MTKTMTSVEAGLEEAETDLEFWTAQYTSALAEDLPFSAVTRAEKEVSRLRDHVRTLKAALEAEKVVSRQRIAMEVLKELAGSMDWYLEGNLAYAELEDTTKVVALYCLAEKLCTLEVEVFLERNWDTAELYVRVPLKSIPALAHLYQD